MNFSWRNGALLYALILLVVRGVFLLAGVDPSEERVLEVFAEGGFAWPSSPERSLYDREELYAGAAAEAIGQGLPIPIESYRFTGYGGGSLLVAVLCTLLFALFGPNILVLKLLALLVSVGGGVAWFAAVRCAFGARTAWLFGALYLFGPSTFVRTSLIAKGDHAEAMALLGVIAYFIARAGAGAGARPGARPAFLAGLVSGLSVWVTYSIVPTLAGIVIALTLSSRVRPRIVWRLAGIGFVLGMAPWALDAWRLGAAAFQIYDRPLTDLLPWGEIARRARAVIDSGLFAGYDLPGGWIVRRVAALAWLGICVAAIVSLARAVARRSTESEPAERTVQLARLAVLSGIAALLGSFVLRAPDASSRYLIPGYPLLFVAVSSAVSWAASATRIPWRRLLLERSFAPFLLAVVVGIVAQGSTIATSHWPAVQRPLSGADWTLLGEVVGAKLSLGELQQLPADVAPAFWRGCGKRVQRYIAPEHWVEAAALAGRDSLSVWEGIGLGWAESQAHDDMGGFAETLPGPRRAAFVAGLAQHGEVLWLQLFARGGAEAIARALRSFPADERPVLERSCARTFAVLATHGARVGSRMAAAASPQILSILSPDVAAQGAGFALFRASIRAPGDLIWRPVAGAWTQAYVEAARMADGPARRGFMDAVARDAELALR